MQIEATLVGAGKGEEALYQIGHSAYFLKCFLERNHAFRLTGCLRHHCALDIGAEHRERRLELVARVGGETAQSGK